MKELPSSKNDKAKEFKFQNDFESNNNSDGVPNIIEDDSSDEKSSGDEDVERTRKSADRESNGLY